MPLYGHDTNIVIQKRAVYEVGYLKYLLRDVTFVSYINVFLNLPIFPRRITYIPAKEAFNIEPVLLRKYLHTHHGKLYKWLCEKKLPMFTSSHLYYHYLLCKAVCVDNPLIDSFAELEAKYPDIAMIKDVSGFYNFHHYMLDSIASPLTKCWLAIEKLHALRNGEERADFLENLFDDYMYADSLLALPLNYRDSALDQINRICHGVRYVKRDNTGARQFLQQFKDKLLRSKKLFRPLQTMILKDIRGYWLYQYYAHIRQRLEDHNEYDVIKRNGSSLIKLVTNTNPNITVENNFEDDDLYSIPHPVTVKLCTTNGLKRTAKMIFAPELGMDITTDEYEESYRNKPVIHRIEKHIKGLVDRLLVECYENRRSASISGPDTKKRRGSISGDILSQNRRSSMPSVLRRGSLAGEISSTRHNSFDLEKEKLVSRMHSGRRPSGLVRLLTPKTVDWSRHKRSRNVELIVEQYLEEELDVFRCCPCVLRDEIYKENYCDALRQVYNESSLKDVDINNLLEVSIASDAIGGEDFKNFLSTKEDKKPLHNYMFWVAIERFAYKYATSQEMMFCTRGCAMNVVGFFSEQQDVSFNWCFSKKHMLPSIQDTENLDKDLFSLLYTYTHPDGSRFTDWEDPFTDSLWFAIVNNYSVQEWLGLAQKFSAKKLMNEWLSYIEKAENEFIQSCTVLHQNKPPPQFLHHTSEDLIFETMNSPNCHVMWAAMQLAEAVEYPGQNVPAIGFVEDGRNLSPEHRSCISSLSSSGKSTSPTRPFSEYQPPSRRMLAGGQIPPNVAPTVTVNNEPAPVETVTANTTTVVQQPAPPQSRRGDALNITDPTLSQLEYNLYNTAGLDLSTDRITSIPKNFLDILRTRELLAKFRQFLQYNEDNHDTSFLFWQIVESLKSCKNPRQRQDRMQFITQKFFGPVSSMKTKLLIDKNCQIYKELCMIKKVTHTMLISAQTLIVKEMESIYWLQFLEMFPSNIREKIMCMNSGHTEKKFGKEKNRLLWVNFTINVINFKKGIMDPEIYKHFKHFLKDYVKAISLKCTKNTQKRQVICNKLIDIEKIEADLDFFIEVEKYKEMCESCQYSARIGNYDPKEEEMTMQKGRVLYNCFIDSLLPPKVQINITHDKVSEIRKLQESCLFERGMFHDAALCIFPILAYFWKKFCLQRYSPTKVPVTDSDKLFLNSRKADYVRKPKVTSPAHDHVQSKPFQNIGVIQVAHVAHGILHLLNRYTESAGLQHFTCQNTHNFTHKQMARDLAESRARSSDQSESKVQLGILVKGDRKLSGLPNLPTDRRSSIMTPGRLSNLRKPSVSPVPNSLLPSLVE